MQVNACVCSKGVQWKEVDDLAAVAADVDVLYQTRIQKERFLDRLEVSGSRGEVLPWEAIARHRIMAFHCKPRDSQHSGVCCFEAPLTGPRLDSCPSPSTGL